MVSAPDRTYEVTNVPLVVPDGGGAADVGAVRLPRRAPGDLGGL